VTVGAAPHAEPAYTWGPGTGTERVLEALRALGREAKRTGEGAWLARCPGPVHAHGDRNPSLSITRGTDRALLYCHAGDATPDIAKALGLPMLALYDAPLPEREARKRSNGSARSQRVGAYLYTDRNGEPLARKVRLEPKSFLWEAPDGDGWRPANRGEGNPRTLYCAELVAEAAVVHVHEGERAADLMNAHFAAHGNTDHAATCAPTTAWDGAFTDALRKKRVTLWVDRDEAGEAQARRAFDSLRAAGVEVTAVRSRVEADHADAFDHLAAGFAADAGEPFAFTAHERSAEQTEAEPPRTLRRLAFTGARFTALADRPAPPPIMPGIPPPGHLTLLIAPKGFGKSTLSDTIAAATATGARPWEDGPILGPGRVLVLSLDESPEVTARRLRRLSMFAPVRDGWNLERAAERLDVLGSDREAPPGLLDAMRLDDDGFSLLEATLTDAQSTGEPYLGVHLDAWIDFLPFDTSENDNRAAARIAGRLQHLAVRFGCYVLVLHHEGKPAPNATEGRDPRFAGRGASALNAKARCVFSIEQVSGSPHLRRIRTVSNLAPVPREALFAVADPKGAADRDELLYWRPSDEVGEYPIGDFLAIGETISTAELTRRLAGIEGSDQPPGDAKRLAIRLRQRWLADNLIEVTEGGAGKATALRRL